MNYSGVPFGGMQTISEIDTVPPLQQKMPFPGVNSPEQGPWEELVDFRSQFPNVQIVPWFNSSVSIVCVTPNLAYDLFVPDNASMGMFFANGDFFITDQGGARVPLAADGTSQEYATQSVFKPVGQMFYLKGKKSFSVVSATANVIVSLGCLITRNVT